MYIDLERKQILTMYLLHVCILGKIEISSGGEIELNQVPIVTPNGDVVVRTMSIKVRNYI